MKSNRQSKIRVPKSGFKRSRFNWSHDVNTTFNWGEIQPTQCKMLIPGSKTTCKVQSLIRLAPMVAPTFGRVKYKTFNQFVAMAEVMPNFDAMMAQEPVSTGFGTKVPQKIPSVNLGQLSASILYGARATLYFANNAQDATNGRYWTQYRAAPNIVPNASDPTCSDWFTAFNRINDNNGNAPFAATIQTDAFNSSANSVMPKVDGVGIRLGKFGTNYGAVYGTGAGIVQVVLGAQSLSDLCPVRREYAGVDAQGNLLPIADYQKEVTLESADYVLEGYYEYSTGNIQYFALAVELSDFGKRLRKIYQGCGYQIDFTGNYDVSILPLLAQYKAYFDIFGLQLYQGWETTYASQIIRDIENRFLTDVTSRFVRSTSSALATISNSNNGLAFIMVELANEWYTDEADYVSAHINKLAVSPVADLDSAGFVDVVQNLTANNNVNIDTTPADYQASLDGTTNSQDEYGIGTLPAAITGGIYSTNSVNHTQIDAELLKRMYKWVNRNTILGRKIAELLRAQGLGKYVDECKSNYIGSSDTLITISDVVSTAATNEAALGEYGGKGLQYDESGVLVFENDEYGYWVTLATVVPEAGYTQGVDPTLTSLDKFNLYNPDFDAIGMECTPKRNIVGSNYLVGSFPDSGYMGFGFIPRYSKFKVCQNLTNGDFNRHGKRNTYLPYTLDKQINVNDYSVDSSGYEYNGVTNKIWGYALINKSARTNDMPIAGNVWREPTKYQWLGNFNRIFLNVGERDDNEISHIGIKGQAVGYTDYNDDNFLGHHIYDVQCYAPMKPIEESYGLDDMEDPTGKAGSEFTHKA